MKIRYFAFRTGAVFMLALALVLAVCRVPVEEGIIITISTEGVQSGDIDKVINDAIINGNGIDGSTPDKPLDLIINGLRFDNTLDMINIFDALRKYYVNITFGPGSGPVFNALPLPDTQDKSKILSVALPGDIMCIGRRAFYGWTGLTTANLPCVISVGSAAFYNCTGLKTVNLPAANFIADGAFQNCTSLKTISLPMASFVGNRAFQNCTGLEMTSLPVASFVSDYAFYGCINLERVEFPALQFLGGHTFSNTGSKAIELVFTLLYPPKFTDASGARITTGINLFDGSFGKKVTVNAPAYFDNYEVWGKKNGTDTEKAAIWGEGITVTYTSN
ncbi:MAG: leucine-rich repeat domain-containing protein [Treponema sp.]|nr:leucine-rich repeat domain-containing protein [Treponema sp.]